MDEAVRIATARLRKSIPYAVLVKMEADEDYARLDFRLSG